MYYIFDYTAYICKIFKQCVIGDGEIGMPVFIRRHNIIHHLESLQLNIPLKVTIKTSKVKDNLICAEKHSTIERDDKVRYIFKSYQWVHFLFTFQIYENR